MTREEFADLVDTIIDWWGPTPAWDSAPRLYDEFSVLDYDTAMAVVRGRTTVADLARYAPRPAELRAKIIESMRQPRNALPEPPPPPPPDGYRTWGEWALTGNRIEGQD